MHTLEPGHATSKPGNRLCPVTICGIAAGYFCFNRRAFYQTRLHSWTANKISYDSLLRCFNAQTFQNQSASQAQKWATSRTSSRSCNQEVNQKKLLFFFSWSAVRAVLTTMSGCHRPLYLVLHWSVTSGGPISEPLKLPHYSFDYKFSWTPGWCNYAL